MSVHQHHAVRKTTQPTAWCGLHCTIPSDCSSQQNKMMASTRRDYSVSTVHIQRVFLLLFVCLYTQALKSCTKPVCLHTVANRSTAKWCSFLLCISCVNQYTLYRVIPILHEDYHVALQYVVDKKADASCFLNLCVDKHYCQCT